MWLLYCTSNIYHIRLYTAKKFANPELHSKYLAGQTKAEISDVKDNAVSGSKMQLCVVKYNCEK